MELLIVEIHNASWITIHRDKPRLHIGLFFVSDHKFTPLIKMPRHKAKVLTERILMNSMKST